MAVQRDFLPDCSADHLVDRLTTQVAEQIKPLLASSWQTLFSSEGASTNLSLVMSPETK